MALVSPPFTTNDLANIDSTGQVKDSGFRVDDVAPAASSILWSSAITQAKYQKFVSPSTLNNLASLTASGQTKDSGCRIDDTAAASPSILWSSQYLQNVISSFTKSVYIRGYFNSTTVTKGNQSVLDGTATSNVGSAWGTNTFTCPKKGYYAVSFIMTCLPTSSGSGADQRITGFAISTSDTFKVTTTVLENTNLFSVCGQCMMSLKAGEFVQFIFLNSTKMNQTLSTPDSNAFSIYEV